MVPSNSSRSPQSVFIVLFYKVIGHNVVQNSEKKVQNIYPEDYENDFTKYFLKANLTLK